MQPFRYFGRTHWTGDRPIARPLPTQDGTTQKNTDVHPYLERDSNPRSQCSSGPRHLLRSWAFRVNILADNVTCYLSGLTQDMEF